MTQRDGGLDLKHGPDRHLSISCVPFSIVAISSMMRILALSCSKGLTVVKQLSPYHSVGQCPKFSPSKQ
jgi:hypothetical protein